MSETIDKPSEPTDLELLVRFGTLDDKTPLSEALVSYLLGLSVKSLRNRRANGEPPPFTSISRSAQVRYPAGGVRKFLEANTYVSTGHQSRARTMRAAGYPEDEPVLPQGKTRSKAPTFGMFLMNAAAVDEVWPCVSYGPHSIPLDLLSALAYEASGALSEDSPEPEAVWMTRADYARELSQGIGKSRAEFERQTLMAEVEGDDRPASRRRGVL